MPSYRAIDLIVFPFTAETKAAREATPGFRKAASVKSGIWDKMYTTPQLIEKMDAAGVEKALICAQSFGTPGGYRCPPELVWQMTKDYPGRLYGTAGIDPRDIRAEVAGLEKAVREYKFVGAHSYPHWFKLSPDDRAYYPFYAKCVELDVPIQIQVGSATQPWLPTVGRPEAFDRIAVDFPDLRIVGIHVGYPFEREMVDIAVKHPNVYIGADSVHPRNWGTDLLELIKGQKHSRNLSLEDAAKVDGPGRDKVMWGTNFPGGDMAQYLAGVDALGLDKATLRYILYDNVKRVYHLD